MRTRQRLWLRSTIGCALALTPLGASAEEQVAEAREEAGSAKTVHVRVAGEDPEVTLERLDADGEWRIICQAPCGKELPGDGDYRLRAGNAKSEPFRFAAGSADLEVRASSSSRDTFKVAGLASMTIGGGTVVFSAAAGATAIFPYGGGCSSCTALIGVGFGMVGLGVVLYAIGATRKLGFETREISTPSTSRRTGLGLTAGGLLWSF